MADQNISSILQEESLDDSQFEDTDLLSPTNPYTQANLVHSPTTDTLDSVALGPNEEYSLLDDTLSDSFDQSKAENVTADQAEVKSNGQNLLELEGGQENGQGGITCTFAQTFVPDSEEEFIQNNQTSDFSSHFESGTVPDNNVVSESRNSDSQTDTAQGSKQEEINISSYFSSGNDQEDPFGTLTQTSDQTANVTDVAVSQTTYLKERENKNVVKEPLDKRLSSQDEPESVDFEAVPEEGGTNVMEASMQLIDDKENFESFTAETGPSEIDQDISLGVSPSNKFLTDKLAKMHMVDNVPPSDGNGGPVEYARQLSSSNQHSVPLGGYPMPSQLTPPAHKQFQGSPFSASQISPFATPTHQPLSTTQQSSMYESVSEVPQHKETTEDSQESPSTENETKPVESESKPVTFSSLPPGDVFDPFTASLRMSDSDRQHDAWLPSEPTRQILITMTTSTPGTFIPTAEQLSTPGIIVDEPQGDPVRDLVYRYMGEQEAIKRQILTVDSVTQDVDGLKKLIEGGCYRSAIDLTRRLLTGAGQGPGKAGQITQHTVHTLQLWFCRLELMIKLRLYSIAESELQAFQNLDTPDLHFEFYPHIYPGRKGSMVPFGMRLLYAELPHYMGRSQEALDRLYYILAVTQKVLQNLNDGYAEDGSAVQISLDSRKGSLEIWLERERQVLYIIGNTFLSIRDFEAAMSVYESLLTKDPSCKAALLSGMGRIYLQMGNVAKANECFKHAEVLSDRSDKSIQCRTYVNKGLEAMCMNNFLEAYQHFKSAVESEPWNTSAVNNLAVCSLYLGKLMDALKTLEVMVHEDPARNLHEGVLFNLCTLYELESSRALHKKQALLDLVSRHKGDGFPVACLKMA